MLYLVIPSVVLGTAAFVLLRARGDIFGYAFGVVILSKYAYGIALCVSF